MKPLLFPLLIGAFCSIFAVTQPPTFVKTTLAKGVYTEGSTFGDVNGDGKLDLVTGPIWWEGPTFEKKHQYRPGRAHTHIGYNHSSFQSWVMDMNGDGRADIFQVSHSGVFHLDLYLQPENIAEKWEMHRVAEKIGNESPEFVDFNGDGVLEFVAMRAGKFGIFTPDEKDVTKPWKFHPISSKKRKFPYYHGLGFGDINGDGKTDLVEAAGWFESPKDPFASEEWTFHPHPFAKKGAAQMLVYDVDGDGDSDIVTSFAAHGYGLGWYESQKEDGNIIFKQHVLVPENEKPGVGEVSFSQSHALALGDFDGDGLTDFATGKRYWAHNGRDPGAKGPAVLYWYQLVRDEKGAHFVPHLIDSDSGVGTHFTTADLNGDGRSDIGIGNKKGVFLFRSQ